MKLQGISMNQLLSFMNVHGGNDLRHKAPTPSRSGLITSSEYLLIQLHEKENTSCSNLANLKILITPGKSSFSIENWF